MASSTADAQINHASSLQRVASGYGNLSLPVLVEARQRLRELLAGGETIQNKAELRRLLATVDEQLTEILTQYPEQLTENLQALVAIESEFQVDNLNTVIANTSAITPESVFATAMSTPVQTGIAGDGVDLGPFIDSWPKAQVDRVSGVLRMGFFQGQTLNEISENIRSPEGALGDMSERSARAVARTSVNHMANTAAQASYHANPDVIGYEWISVLDSRTTPICRSRSGNKYYYADNKPDEVPPAHFSCRSSTAALFTDDLQAENEAAGSNESTDDYYPWLKGQPASVQDDALGPVRAEIFRSAGLSTSEFRAAVTDRFDQPLTLEEMAAKNTKIEDFLEDED